MQGDFAVKASTAVDVEAMARNSGKAKRAIPAAPRYRFRLLFVGAGSIQRWERDIESAEITR